MWPWAVPAPRGSEAACGFATDPKGTTMKTLLRFSLFLAAACLTGSALKAQDRWVVYEGKEGPGKGNHIVLVSGDEEYRSEEALPQLAHILSKHHGFKCTVLFAIDTKDG